MVDQTHLVCDDADRSNALDHPRKPPSKRGIDEIGQIATACRRTQPVWKFSSLSSQAFEASALAAPTSFPNVDRVGNSRGALVNASAIRRRR